MATLHQTDLPNLLYRGKVRDTHDLGSGLLLMVATDRISAFDVVLPTLIPFKGLVLAALSSFWFRKTAHIVHNHLEAYPASEIRGTLTRFEDALRRLPEWLLNLPEPVNSRAMVVRKAQRIDVECVVRGYLAGSAWVEYQRSGTVHGERLAAGLREGERLSSPLFTPTTKAEQGHDEPLTRAQLTQMVGPSLAGTLEEKTLALYRFASDYALSQGVIIADTKVEFGLWNGQLLLIDELFTPDSSRFWDASAYAPGKSQPNFDKQFVRDWLTETGWNREPPAPALPKDIVEKTQQRYFEAYRRLAGEDEYRRLDELARRWRDTEETNQRSRAKA